MKTRVPIILRRRPAIRRLAGFTLVELLVVIAIVGILASLVVGLAGVATRKSRLNQAKAMLTELVGAIEDYKSKMGHYPPDNPASPATSQLFYELVGTYSTDNGATFTTPDGMATINSGTVNMAFGVAGFVNAAPNAAQSRSFLKGLSPRKHATLPVPPAPAALAGVHVLTTTLPGINGPFNTWRYVSSNPTNNPRTFDLWIEYMVGDETNTIGNWNFR